MRKPQLDLTLGLIPPPYRIDASMVARPSPESLLATYRVFTPSFDEQLKTNRNPLQFDVSITAEFSIGNLMPDDQIESFVRVGGLIVAWPFLRQTVADLCIKSGFPPLFLPLITVPVTFSAVDAIPSPPSNPPADQLSHH